jgi:hypothetical protein
MQRFAILKVEGLNVAIMTENVTYVEEAIGGTNVHFVGGGMVTVDENLNDALRKLHRL